MLVVGWLFLAGCADDEPATPPVPASVAELDPCALLTQRERVGLRLRAQGGADEGHRRSCSFIATDLEDKPREAWINTLEITVRDSQAANRVADAKRVAETYQRERGAELDRTTVEGREVYRVGPADPIGCRLLLHVNATSSVEVAPRMDGQAPDCVHPDLARLISAKLPVADPAPARADHDRPVDILVLDPCALISADLRADLRLDAGSPATTVVRSCRYHAPGTRDGELSFVSVQLWTSGARGPDDEQPATRVVNERTAYETRESTGSGAGSISMCDYRLEVTTATSVEISSWALGGDSLEPACGTAEDLAADIEPKLPLIVT
ncbi:hypothetical protein GCM10027436_62840 [Actinophytocola sediminis]